MISKPERRKSKSFATLEEEIKHKIGGIWRSFATLGKECICKFFRKTLTKCLYLCILIAEGGIYYECNRKKII